MSDRILVLHEGRVTAEIARADATEERVMFAATGNLDRRRRWTPPSPGRRMTNAGAAATLDAARATAAPGSGVIARQRELSLVAIMVVLGALVSIAAPQFLTVDNISPGRGARLDHRRRRGRRGARRHHPQRRPVGRGDDRPRRLLRRRSRSRTTCSTRRARSCSGSAIGLVLGMINGFIVTVLRVPAIVATLGTLSIFRGRRLPHRGQPPGPDGGPAAGLHGRRPRRHPRDPDLRRRRDRRRGHRVRPAALDQVRSAVLRGRQQPRGGGHPRHPVTAGRLRRLRAVRPAGRHRRRHVRHRIRDDQRDVRRRLHARRSSPRSSSAASTSSAARGPSPGRRSARSSSASSPTPSSSSACRSSGCRPSTASSSSSRSAPTPSSCVASSEPPR